MINDINEFLNMDRKTFNVDTYKRIRSKQKRKVIEIEIRRKGYHIILLSDLIEEFEKENCEKDKKLNV